MSEDKPVRKLRLCAVLVFIDSFSTTKICIFTYTSDSFNEGHSVCSLIRYDLSSLRVLGTVGEPINPEAWQWFYEEVGRSRCPVVDTFWQTETVRDTLFCFKVVFVVIV